MAEGSIYFWQGAYERVHGNPLARAWSRHPRAQPLGAVSLRGLNFSRKRAQDPLPTGHKRQTGKLGSCYFICLAFSPSWLETKTVFYEITGPEAGSFQAGELGEAILGTSQSPAAGCPLGPTRVAVALGSVSK